MASKSEIELAAACNEVLKKAGRVVRDNTGHSASVVECVGVGMLFLAAAGQGAEKYIDGKLNIEEVDRDKN